MTLIDFYWLFFDSYWFLLFLLLSSLTTYYSFLIFLTLFFIVFFYSFWLLCLFWILLTLIDPYIDSYWLLLTLIDSYDSYLLLTFWWLMMTHDDSWWLTMTHDDSRWLFPISSDWDERGRRQDDSWLHCHGRLWSPDELLRQPQEQFQGAGSHHGWPSREGDEQD